MQNFLIVAAGIGEAALLFLDMQMHCAPSSTANGGR